MSHTKSRTTGDLVIGALVVILGIVVLANTYIATTVSLVFFGWLLFAGGVVTLAATLFRIGKDGFWVGALGGGLMTVLGLVFLRHTQAAAVTVTLVAGAMFLLAGIARLAAAFAIPEGRIPLLLSGGVSTVLGLIVLFNLFTASLTFLGLILGIQILAEGLSIMIVGRGSLGASRAGQPSGARPSTT